LLVDHDEPPYRVPAAAERLGRPLRIALLPVGLELRCTLLDHKPSPLSAPNTTIRARPRRECWKHNRTRATVPTLGHSHHTGGRQPCLRMHLDRVRSRSVSCPFRSSSTRPPRRAGSASTSFTSSAATASASRCSAPWTTRWWTGARS